MKERLTKDPPSLSLSGVFVFDICEMSLQWVNTCSIPLLVLSL